MRYANSPSVLARLSWDCKHGVIHAGSGACTQPCADAVCAYDLAGEQVSSILQFARHLPVCDPMNCGDAENLRWKEECGP